MDCELSDMALVNDTVVEGECGVFSCISLKGLYIDRYLELSPLEDMSHC